MKEIEPNDMHQQTIIFFWGLILSCVTSALLIINLIIQRKANSLSNKKFLYDIKPFFEISKNWSCDFNNTTIDRYANYEIVLHKNLMLNFKMVNNIRDCTIPIIIHDSLKYIAINRPIQFIATSVSPEKYNSEINISLFFSDEIGTKYEQVINGTINDLQLGPAIKK